MTDEPKCPLCGIGKPAAFVTGNGPVNTEAHCDNWHCYLPYRYWTRIARLVEAAAILSNVPAESALQYAFYKRIAAWKEQGERDARCTCPTLNDQKVTGSSCPLHGLPSKPFDTTDERSERDE